MLKRLLALGLIIGAVTLILSFVLAVSLMVALAVMLLMVFAPVLGILLIMYLPAPTIIKSIIGLSVTILFIVFGLRYLGVM